MAYLFSRTSSSGFTLIEMAIVLVVIGLILGMVFKGRELIDQGKVKNVAVQYNKIIAGINTFYDRYGFYPGDGCGDDSDYVVSDPSPADCNGERNGYVDGMSENDSAEGLAFWQLLIEATDILSYADRESVFGQPWEILEGNNPGAGLPSQTDWIDLPGGAQADPRIVCALDKMIDDGEASEGDVITFGDPYDPDTDCWNLSGQVNVHLKVLP
jgi:prepilin-type N-terminal cleavage/methylation domain-containing protein